MTSPAFKSFRYMEVSPPGTGSGPAIGSLRRVVLSTDLAETSVTVEGVGIVVDAGLARRPMHNPATGLTKLRTVTTSRASADQRSGRAGRTAPGVAYRLWSEADHLARSLWTEPEILSAELAALVLELSVWGTRVASLRWLDPPPSAAVATARQLLEGLGALQDGRLTSLGRRLVELPVHPRLGRMLVDAPRHDLPTAALLAALLSERDVFGRSTADGALSADVASRLAVLERTTTGSRPRSTAPQSLPSGGAPTSSSDASSERRRRIARRSRRCRWARPITTQARCLSSVSRSNRSAARRWKVPVASGRRRGPPGARSAGERRVVSGCRRGGWRRWN